MVYPHLPLRADLDGARWEVSGVCQIPTKDTYLAPMDVLALSRHFPYRTGRKGFSFTGIRNGRDGLVLSFVWNE